MRIGDASWREMIRRHASDLGLDPTDVQIGRFAAHAAELLRWNRRINITRITRPEDVALRHVVDSLALVPHVTRCRSLLDIGSGGGFPGMVVKIMLPDCRLVMVDSVRKKISFLTHAVRVLGLEHATAVHSRAETLSGEPGYAGAFDGVTCRALTDLPACLELAMPFLNASGALFAMRGARGKEEATELMKSPPWAALMKASGGRAEMDCIGCRLPREVGRRYIVSIRPGMKRGG